MAAFPNADTNGVKTAFLPSGCQIAISSTCKKGASAENLCRETVGEGWRLATFRSEKDQTAALRVLTTTRYSWLPALYTDDFLPEENCVDMGTDGLESTRLDISNDFASALDTWFPTGTRGKMAFAAWTGYTSKSM